MATTAPTTATGAALPSECARRGTLRECTSGWNWATSLRSLLAATLIFLMLTVLVETILHALETYVGIPRWSPGLAVATLALALLVAWASDSNVGDLLGERLGTAYRAADIITVVR